MSKALGVVKRISIAARVVGELQRWRDRAEARPGAFADQVGVGPDTLKVRVVGMPLLFADVMDAEP